VLLPELVQPLHPLNVRQERGVLLLPHELSADAVRLQRGESDAMPPHEVRRGNAVEHSPQLVLDGAPAVGVDGLEAEVGGGAPR